MAEPDEEASALQGTDDMLSTLAKRLGIALTAIFTTQPASAATIEDLRARLTEAIAACEDGFGGTATLCEATCKTSIEKIAGETSLGGLSVVSKLWVGNCANILERAKTPQAAFVPVITYHNTGSLPDPLTEPLPVAEPEPSSPVAPTQSLCRASAKDVATLLDGNWLMRKSEGVVTNGDLKLPAMAGPKGIEDDVTITGSHQFTLHHNNYRMTPIDGAGDLFKDRDDMEPWLAQALEKAPQALSSTCDKDWPMFKVYGKAIASEFDIRLIAYSSTCMVGVHSIINQQLDGTPLPSGVNGVVLYKGPNGCE